MRASNPEDDWGLDEGLGKWLEGGNRVAVPAIGPNSSLYRSTNLLDGTSTCHPRGVLPGDRGRIASIPDVGRGVALLPTTDGPVRATSPRKLVQTRTGAGQRRDPEGQQSRTLMRGWGTRNWVPTAELSAPREPPLHELSLSRTYQSLHSQDPQDSQARSQGAVGVGIEGGGFSGILRAG